MIDTTPRPAFVSPYLRRPLRDLDQVRAGQQPAADKYPTPPRAAAALADQKGPKNDC